MQFAQSMAQRQMAFSRVLNFLILILLDFLVQLFFYVILSERSESKDLLDFNN